MNNKFIILVGSRNNSLWVDSNLDSILLQDYQNYEVIYFDDASDDNTLNLVKEKVKSDPRFHIIDTKERKLKSWFFSTIDEKVVQDNNILVFLDGDDMFYAQNTLSYLNEIYNQNNCWMTYGGMSILSDDGIQEPFPQNSQIPDEIIKQKAHRKDTWRTSHLKSMRGFVWRFFDKSDLKYNENFIVGPDDLAIMFASLEMCPPEKVYRITEPIYLYNHTTQNQKSRAFIEQRNSNTDYETIIRNRQIYPILSFVTPSLVGGLGNQMFEIAAAAALAKDNNAVLLVDNSKHLCPNQGRNVNNYVDNIFSRLTFDKNLEIKNDFYQQNMSYAPILYRPNICIHGHFQSLKHFDHQRKFIQELFSPPTPILKDIEKNYSWLTDYTAIQVRRGDALEDRCKGYHPVHTPEYFQTAVKMLNAERIIVFSDDMEWCRKELKFKVPCNFDVSQGTERDYMEIYLMSICKNIIISASTFGWWGAYLNTRPDKKVCAPNNFFGPKYMEMGFKIEELIPDDWIKL